MPQIIAIKTTFHGETMYVKSLSRKNNGQFIVNYTGDSNQAHDFQTEEIAYDKLKHFVNPNNYVFTPVPLQV